jgi:hypothetical protein
MRQEFDFLTKVFGAPAPAQPAPAQKQEQTVPGKRGRKPKVARDPPPPVNDIKNVLITDGMSHEIPMNTVEQTDIPTEVREIQMPSEPPKFKDSKEQKVWQKEQEEARKRANETAGIQLSQVLTKENLKQWIEVEGKTYAWVAREKAGCPDTQVAAQAQMMGIKSKISKKRFIQMGSHR